MPRPFATPLRRLAFTLPLVTAPAACLEIERTSTASSASDASADTAPGTYCPNANELRCHGSDVQQCIGNIWKTSLTCPDGYACEGTGCVCIKPCGNRQCGVDSCGFSCGECDPGLFCSDGYCLAECTPRCDGRVCGDDGCGGSCGSCPNTQACLRASGTCGPSRSCAEILMCQSNCVKIGGDVAECGSACLDETSAAVQTEYAVVDSCITNSGCQDLVCVSEQCGLQYVGCYFDKAGQYDCASAAGCALSCPNGDLDCLMGCLESGTQTAQLTWVRLNLCVSAVCGLDASQACANSAVASTCRTDYEACFGPLPAP